MKENAGEKLFTILNYTFMIILIMVFLVPYWLIFSASFTDELSILKNGFRLIPEKLSLSAYQFIFFNNTLILSSVKNSMFITLTGTALAVLVTTMFAYPLSKKYLPGRKGIMIYILITMLFGGGLIPFYLVVRGIGLYNSLWAVIVPAMMSSWNMILVRNYFMTIPDSLEESARVDGANDMVIYLRIMLPLSKPIIATIALFYAVGYWNEWFLPLIFLSDRNKLPIQVLIRELLSNFSQLLAQSGVLVKRESLLPQESTKMAAVVIASLPIIVVYPFLQKYFVKGILIGSIKG